MIFIVKWYKIRWELLELVCVCSNFCTLIWGTVLLVMSWKWQRTKEWSYIKTNGCQLVTFLLLKQSLDECGLQPILRGVILYAKPKTSQTNNFDSEEYCAWKVIYTSVIILNLANFWYFPVFRSLSIIKSNFLQHITFIHLNWTKWSIVWYQNTVYNALWDNMVVYLIYRKLVVLFYVFCFCLYNNSTTVYMILSI